MWSTYARSIPLNGKPMTLQSIKKPLRLLNKVEKGTLHENCCSFCCVCDISIVLDGSFVLFVFVDSILYLCEKVNDFLSLFPDFVVHDSNLFSMNNRTINVCNVESSSEGKKPEFQRQKRENVSRFWPILDTIHPNEIVHFLSFV